MNVWNRCCWCRGQYDGCRHCANGELPSCAQCQEHVVDGDDVSADALEEIAVALEAAGGLCGPCAMEAKKARNEAEMAGALPAFGSTLAEVAEPFGPNDHESSGRMFQDDESEAAQ